MKGKRSRAWTFGCLPCTFFGRKSIHPDSLHLGNSETGGKSEPKSSFAISISSPSHKAKQKQPSACVTTAHGEVPTSQTITQPSKAVPKIHERDLPNTDPSPANLRSLLSNATLESYQSYDSVLYKYKVAGKLNEGTCAQVLLAVHSVSLVKVAIKRQEKKTNTLRQLAREADIHICLKHQNIAAMLEISEGPSEVVMVQEYCAGGELFDAVVPEVGCPHSMASSYIVQICDALEYLHSRRIAHRDLKPENIMLTHDKRTIKLIDFGLSEYIHPPGHMYKRRVGTVPYMDPVLWQSSKGDNGYADVDLEAIDIWAAGVVLFCMLCGRFPWAEATFESTEFAQYVNNDFSHYPWTRLGKVQLSLLQGMLAINPASRFSARQVRAFVQKYWPPAALTYREETLSNPVMVTTSRQSSVAVLEGIQATEQSLADFSGRKISGQSTLCNHLKPAPISVPV